MSDKKDEKAEQLRIPGTDQKRNKKIEEKAAAYVTLRDRRMATLEKEIDAQAELVAAMEEEKLQVYRIDEDTMVQLLDVKKAKVKKVKDEDDD